MKKSRSAVFKILKNCASSDRTINTFPRPYDADYTPYKALDFDSATRKSCVEMRPHSSELKISKAIILGDVGVGKSCLVNRFCHQLFDGNYKATIGVDFEVERFDILSVPFNLQIWDTAGQERFKCIAQSYYRSSHIIVLVFDLSKLMTLSHIKTWLQEALKANTGTPHIFLVGTKIDTMSPSAYSNTEKFATRIAREINAEYWAVSSKTGNGVKELFFRMAALAFDAAILREKEQSTETKINGNVVSLKMNKEIKKPKEICTGCKF